MTVTSEPRVEELLATIRKAIDRDITELDAREGVASARATAPPPLRGSLMQDAPSFVQREARDADANIASLRDRVRRHRMETPQAEEPAPAPPPPPRSSFQPVPRTRLEPIMRPTPSLYEPLPEEAPAHAYHPQSVPYQPEPAPYYPPPEPAYADPGYIDQNPVEAAPHYQAQQAAPQALMSPHAAQATQASFQALASAMLGQLGGGEALQNTARDMLRPLLKHWLDENLPSLVEQLVREEIERVARRGR